MWGIRNTGRFGSCGGGVFLVGNGLTLPSLTNLMILSVISSIVPLQSRLNFLSSTCKSPVFRWYIQLTGVSLLCTKWSVPVLVMLLGGFVVGHPDGKRVRVEVDRISKLNVVRSISALYFLLEVKAVYLLVVYFLIQSDSSGNGWKGFIVSGNLSLEVLHFYKCVESCCYNPFLLREKSEGFVNGRNRLSSAENVYLECSHGIFSSIGGLEVNWTRWDHSYPALDLYRFGYLKAWTGRL